MGHLGLPNLSRTLRESNLSIWFEIANSGSPEPVRMATLYDSHVKGVRKEAYHLFLDLREGNMSRSGVLDDHICFSKALRSVMCDIIPSFGKRLGGHIINFFTELVGIDRQTDLSLVGLTVDVTSELERRTSGVLSTLHHHHDQGLGGFSVFHLSCLDVHRLGMALRV
jgi:hypothetical protein